MRPLVDAMTAEDPAQRPTMDEVVERFAKIRNGSNSWKLRSRVVKAGDSPYGYVPRTLVYWCVTIGYVLRRTPAIPSVARNK
jgi:hypothetical protein